MSYRASRFIRLRMLPQGVPAEVIDGLRLYGGMHRFIPIYAHMNGGRIAEMEVNHRPRVHGRSKYGLTRVFKSW